MFSTLPQTSDELKGKTWADLQPFYSELESWSLTAETVSRWLADFSRLSDLVEEYGVCAFTATSRDTTDAEADRRYKAYVEQIEPQVRAADQRLKLKLLDSGFVPDGCEVALRNLRAEVDLFREANLPLLAEEAKLRSEYFKITGAQTVNWDGLEKLSGRWNCCGAIQIVICANGRGKRSLSASYRIVRRSTTCGKNC